KLGKNASYLFSELSKLESIEGGNYLNTVQTTNMNSMFYKAQELTKVNVSNWNTSQVTTMSELSKLESIEGGNYLNTVQTTIRILCFTKHKS
ncbi:bacterial surface protein 26-residue, partial [Enterococcus moraviensis ATCC BAA-383]